MHKNYRNRFEKVKDCLFSPQLQSNAILDNPHSFTRTRKLPLADLILSTLSKKGLTTTMELIQYLKQKGADFMNLSKQGYLQQRKKLNYKVFSFLNQEYLQDFYQSEEPILWKNYLVFAVDGTKAEVPNSKEKQATFGESGNQTDRTVTSTALLNYL